MTMNEFLDILQDGTHAGGVPYIQKQNSNLTEEFVTIMSDVEVDLALGSEAFGMLIVNVVLFTCKGQVAKRNME